ncbi:DUF7427 family protein [Nocardia farcinica]|uniref:DUF7427 family protein n=1 Tax=Nocardia farcinica TaxID=37329 RepID=UPI004038B343
MALTRNALTGRALSGKHPWLIRGFTMVTVAHLLNWLPPVIDPYAWVGRLKEINGQA